MKSTFPYNLKSRKIKEYYIIKGITSRDIRDITRDKCLMSDQNLNNNRLQQFYGF